MASCQECINHLMERIQGGDLLPKAMFSIDVDRALEERERPEFENTLVQHFKKVDERKASQGKSEFEGIENFVEFVYMHVFEFSESDDLSAYISDDFGLTVEAILLGYESDWLNSLVSVYGSNEIPRTELSPVSGTLESVVMNL